MIILNKISSDVEFRNTDYFTNMNKDELDYRIKSIHNYYPELSMINDIRTLYTKLTDDFTEEEMEAIKYYHNIVSYTFKTKLPLLCPNTKEVKYIKLKKNIDWNYPYTINHCIVLPVVFLKSMVSSFNYIKPVRSDAVWNLVRPNYKIINKIACTICHEMIHITQRYKLFSELEEIYTNVWGFEKHSYKTKNGVITNPDGKNGEWSVIIEEKRYFPILVLVNDEPSGGLIDSITGVIYDFPDSYIRRFNGFRDQLYHPNEIFANLVSRYIIHGNMFIPNWNSSPFYYSLNKFV